MSILVIDDEDGLRRSLCAFLEDMGHDTLEAANGQEGLDILFATPDISAVVVDLNMPVLDGYGFLEGACARVADLPIIVLSGVGVVDDALRAVRLGAWDFLTKPLPSLRVFEHTLNNALEKARLIRENKQYHENLERLVQERTAELERARRQIMYRLSRAAEYKDNETGKHVIRVGEMAAVLGQAMGLDAKTCANLRECAPLHDIGKIGVADHVLLKPDALNPEERQSMQQHCFFGCEILGPLISREEATERCRHWYESSAADNELLDLARMVALLHHERWDGTGYPFGLQGEAIPLAARIVTVVDVYDALASARPYKDAFPEERCLGILREGAGSHFDPAIIDAFFQNLAQIQDIRRQWSD